MNKNKIKEPLIIVSFAIVLLFVLSLSKNPHIFGLTFKPFSLFSDILNEKADTAINDSNRIVIKDTIKRDLSNIVDYKNDSALNRFFESLRKTKAGHHQTRIAYFGDSYIEGDLVTQDFRKLLQDEFGGGGVGYMPITSIVASFRSSVIHTFEGWKTYSYVKHPPDSHNLFISGYVFSPVLYDEADTSSDKAISRVRYSGVARPRLNSFNRIRLFYGNSKGNNTVNISGAIYPLNAPGILNQVEIKSKTNFRSVDADFKCVSSIDIYGMSLESDTGVIVDNFSFRGNSGLPMQMVWPAMYNQSNLYLGYDLIIIEYGLNAITEKATEYHWYERGFFVNYQVYEKMLSKYGYSHYRAWR